MVLFAVFTAFLLLLRYTLADDPPPDFPGTDDPPYTINPTGTDAPTPTGTLTPQNILGTWLYSYKDCEKNFGDTAVKQINDAYYDAWTISNTAGVKSDIDWNSAPALEFLGPPGFNSGQQSQIQAVFKNVATMIYSYGNPFTHYIKVRCDDPANRCQNRPDNDPCEPEPTNPDSPKKTPLAYSTNSDSDSPGYPMINFCGGFFGRKKLSDAISYGKGLASPDNLKLASYDNQAQTFLHELYHLDLAADSPTPNPRVDDLMISIKLKVGIGFVSMRVYGTLLTKVLARWSGDEPDDFPTGYYVQRNADNLAYYALAKYVMRKNGNVYPHLPIVTLESVGPPYPPFPGALSVWVSDGSNFYWNTTDGTFTTDWGSPVIADYPGCSDDDNANANEISTITIDGFAPDSAYPDDYLTQLAGWISDLSSTDGSREGSGAGGGQQIALASYINPLGDPASWSRLLAYDSDKVSVLVANVLNGPNYVVDTSWQSVIDQAASSGKRILGYVRTGYLGVSEQQFTTRLGSHDLADWASQIEQDVDTWYELYGSSLGGIFFDEGWPECGDNNIYSDLYKYINDYTKRKHSGAFTVLNPGSPIAQCFENTMDTLLTFESSYETYTTAYVPNDWTPADPRKIWHIVYTVPQDQVATVAALALSRSAGLLEMTDDDEPNPYDTLPADAYMQDAINAVAGGRPLVNDPSAATGAPVIGLPSDTAVAASDYSSVTLTWSSVSGALGYAIYMNGAEVLELSAARTRATVGGIEPGTSGISFEVRAILASGSGGSAHVVTASTTGLPSTGTIANVGYTQD